MLTKEEKRAAELIRQCPEEHKIYVFNCFQQFFAEKKIPPDDSPLIHSGDWVREVEEFTKDFLKESQLE